MSYHYSNRRTSAPPSSTEFKCVGYAPHGKAGDGSCSNPILMANRYQVIQALDRIRSSTLSSHELSDELEYVAELALCKRWHRGQARALAAYWKATFFAPSRERHPPQETRSPRGNLEHPAAARSPRSAIRRPEPAAVAPVRPSTAQLPTPPASPPAVRRAVQAPGPTPSPSSAAGHELDLIPAVVTAATDTPQSTIPHEPSCHPATRRPLNANSTCLICHEPLTVSEPVVWCKAGCGQNLHASCWSTWTDFRLRNAHTGSLQCCYCRAEWTQERCTCDDMPPEVDVEPTIEDATPAPAPAVEIEAVEEEDPVDALSPLRSHHVPEETIDAPVHEPPSEDRELSADPDEPPAQGHGIFYYLLRPWRILDRFRASSIMSWLRGTWTRSRPFRALLWLFERSVQE